MLNVSSKTISRHLKMINEDKKKKMDKWVPHELNENHKSKRFEISSSLIFATKMILFSIKL